MGLGRTFAAVAVTLGLGGAVAGAVALGGTSTSGNQAAAQQKVLAADVKQLIHAECHAAGAKIEAPAWLATGGNVPRALVSGARAGRRPIARTSAEAAYLHAKLQAAIRTMRAACARETAGLR